MAIYCGGSTANYREYAAITAYDPATFSVACRVMFKSLGVVFAAMARGNGSVANNWNLGVDSSGALYRFAVRPSDTTQRNATGGAITTGVWASMMGVHDGTNIILYINGVAAATTPCSVTMAASTDSIRVLSRSDGTNACDAVIDDVRMWKRALTSTEALSYHLSRNLSAVGRDSLIIQDAMTAGVKDTVYKAGVDAGTIMFQSRSPGQVIARGQRFPFNSQPVAGPPSTTNSQFFFAAA